MNRIKNHFFGSTFGWLVVTFVIGLNRWLVGSRSDFYIANRSRFSWFHSKRVSNIRFDYKSISNTKIDVKMMRPTMWNAFVFGGNNFFLFSLLFFRFYRKLAQFNFCNVCKLLNMIRFESVSIFSIVTSQVWFFSFRSICVARRRQPLVCRRLLIVIFNKSIKLPLGLVLICDKSHEMIC